MVLATTVWVLFVWTGTNWGTTTGLIFADKASCEHVIKEFQMKTDENLGACVSAANLVSTSNQMIASPSSAPETTR